MFQQAKNSQLTYCTLMVIALKNKDDKINKSLKAKLINQFILCCTLLSYGSLLKTNIIAFLHRLTDFLIIILELQRILNRAKKHCAKFEIKKTILFCRN